MSLARGTAFSFGCALVGTAAWAGISLATDMRLGLLAIVVGGLAGFGMAMGCRGKGGVGAGVLAACMCLVAVFLGRGVVSGVNSARWVAENAPQAEQVCIHEIANQVYDEFEAAGKPMTESDDEFPPEVMATAQRQWNALPTEEQQLRLNAAHDELETGKSAATGVLTVVMLVVDFGLFGFVFLALAMATAYKGGSVRAVKTEDGWQVADEEPAPAQQPASELSGMPRGFPTGSSVQDEDPLERLKRMRSKAAETAPAGNGASEGPGEAGEQDGQRRAA